MKYKKHSLLLLVMGLTSLAKAGGPDLQSVGSAGGSLKNSNYSFDINVGEVAVANIGTVSIGFLQPEQSKIILAFDNLELDRKTLSVYPNPVSTSIKWNLPDNNVKQVSLFDISGKKVLEADASLTEINVEDLPGGMYYLEFRGSDLKKIESFKIIKN